MEPGFEYPSFLVQQFRNSGLSPVPPQNIRRFNVEVWAGGVFSPAVRIGPHLACDRFDVFPTVGLNGGGHYVPIVIHKIGRANRLFAVLKSLV